MNSLCTTFGLITKTSHSINQCPGSIYQSSDNKRVGHSVILCRQPRPFPGPWECRLTDTEVKGRNQAPASWERERKGGSVQEPGSAYRTITTQAEVTVTGTRFLKNHLLKEMIPIIRERCTREAIKLKIVRTICCNIFILITGIYEMV